MEQYDVVVLGTGAAGLTAAIAAHEGGAPVAVFEKADLVGGTTAWSGGQVWIPNNPHMPEVGVEDSREKALTYIMSLSRDMLEPRLVEAYVDAGPEMVELLEAKTPVQFYAVPGMPDYHPEFPGGSPGGGRTLECPIYPFDELGEWADRVTPSPYFADPHITMSETPLGKAVPEPPSAEEHARRRRSATSAAAARPSSAGCCGPASTGASSPAPACAGRELIVEDGAVVGVVVDTPDGTVEVRANKGVILASGGFEWNERPGARVPARPDDPPRLDRDPHRRRPAHGDEGRGDDLEHARGVVDPRRRRAARVEPDGPGARQRPAHAAALDHGQPPRPPLHERGGQLQRVRRRLPRGGRVEVRVRQPARAG